MTPAEPIDKAIGRNLPALAALAVLVAAGMVRHGLDDEPAAAAALQRAAEGLPGRLPELAGEWSGRTIEVDRRGLDRAGIAALAARQYTNERTGEAVTALLVCGRPGPIAAHTPESCYPGIGFDRVGASNRIKIGPSEFWSATFQGGSPAAPRTLRALWAWNVGEPGTHWIAPENPRLRLAARPVMYKLYLLDESGRAPELARSLLPRIDELAARGP